MLSILTFFSPMGKRKNTVTFVRFAYLIIVKTYFRSNAAKKESDDQLTEIKNILQERNDTVRRLEQDKTELEVYFYIFVSLPDQMITDRIGTITRTFGNA